MNIIELKNISFSYDKTDFINNLSLDIPTKSIYGFVGPNGAGKTTIIKLILGLLNSDSGTIYINGNNLKKQNTYSHKKIGSLVESPSLYLHLTALENMNVAKLLYNLTEDNVISALTKVGLFEERNKIVKNFSMGMRQRLGIALAIINKPNLIILDEPFNSIDPNGRNALKRLLKELRDSGVTVFISSHELAEVEKICTHLAIIDKGNIVYNGSIESFLINQPKKIRIVCSNQILLYKSLQEKGFSIEGDLVVINNKESFSKLLHSITAMNIDIYSIDTITGGLELFFSHLKKK